MEEISDIIRNQAEKCDNLSCFQFFNSISIKLFNFNFLINCNKKKWLGGGTGSGLGY